MIFFFICYLNNLQSNSDLQALVVYECLSEWGQIVCSICPNPKLVITGGTSTAICVWETGTSKERAKSLMLKQVKAPLPKKKTHLEFYPSQLPETTAVHILLYVQL